MENRKGRFRIAGIEVEGMRSESYSPVWQVRALWAAVIFRAFMDLRLGEYREEVLMWLESEDFEDLADSLGLDAKLLQGAARKMCSTGGFLPANTKRAKIEWKGGVW